MALPSEDDRDAIDRAFAELVAGYHLTADQPDPRSTETSDETAALADGLTSSRRMPPTAQRGGPLITPSSASSIGRPTLRPPATKSQPRNASYRSRCRLSSGLAYRRSSAGWELATRSSSSWQRPSVCAFPPGPAGSPSAALSADLAS